MDRVAAFDLIDRQLQRLAAEDVASIPQPVRPGQQRLAARAIRHAVERISVQHWLPVDLDLAQPTADFDHHRPLTAAVELELPPRGRLRPHAVTLRAYASGFTNDGKGSWRMPATRFCAAMLAILPRVANEAEAMCGTTRQFGRLNSL